MPRTQSFSLKERTDFRNQPGGKRLGNSVKIGDETELTSFLDELERRLEDIDVEYGKPFGRSICVSLTKT